MPDRKIETTLLTTGLQPTAPRLEVPHLTKRTIVP